MRQQECPERHDELIDQQSSELAGFSATERERLISLRRLVKRGQRGEHYPRDKRQDFVRWLVNQGKLSDT